MRMCKKSAAVTLLTLVLCFGICSETVMAAEVKGASINVNISLSGTLPAEDENFTVQLIADDGNAPMPNGSADNIYSMSITGENEKAFPAVTYTELGTYHYTIKQEPGLNNDCRYDNSVYSLTVNVVNSEKEQDSFEISYALHKDGGKEKLDEVIFENEYKTVIRGVPKTGDKSDILSNIMTGALALIVFWAFVSRGNLSKKNV